VTYTPDPQNLPSVYDQLEQALTEIAQKPHYRVRNGKVLRSRRTGEPLTAKGPGEEAAKLLAAIRRDRGILGLEEPASTPRPAESPDGS
jgi:hypothetical protein